MAITDLLPSNPAQGFSVLFNASAIGLSVLKPPQRVVLDTFTVDCTLSESIDYEADVTEYEVEKGANINDHRRTKPVEFSIAGLVSDTPLDTSLILDAMQLAAGPLGIASGAVQAGLNLASGDALMSSLAFATLQALFDVGSLETADGTFTIVTKYRIFQNMVVKSLRFTRDSRTGAALPFTATFKEIRTVETATTTINGPAMLQAPTDLGQKSTTDASPALKANAQSLLLQLDGKSGGLLAKTFPVPPPELLQAP